MAIGGVVLLAPLLGLTVAVIDPLYKRPAVPADAAPQRQRRALRVLSLNVAHGRGTSFHQLLTRRTHIERNLEAIAELIRQSDADVVALQELDAPSAWSGGFDHLAFLQERTELPHAFHGLHLKRAKLAYGTGILSRYPIEAEHSHAFSLNALDTKGYVRTRIATPQGAVDVVSLHLDFKRDSERALQLAQLSERLAERENPAQALVVAGDFNCRLEGADGVLAAFAEEHGLATPAEVGGTFPSGRPSRRIDYVLARGLAHRREVVLPLRLSDHCPVLADLVFPAGD